MEAIYTSCTAATKATGNRCKRRPIPGGTVCVKHGGGAPQVQAKAAERLLADRLVMEFGLERARDPERVIAEIGCIAFTSVGDLFDEQGNMLPIKQLPKHVQAAIGNHETVTGNVDKGDGQSDRLIRIKLWDKPKMLEMLAKHHKLIGDEKTVNVNFVAIDARIQEGRRLLRLGNSDTA